MKVLLLYFDSLPRKSAFSLYIYTPDGYTSDQDLQSLGKFKMGKACIYVNKLADIKLDVLRKIALQSILAPK